VLARHGRLDRFTIHLVHKHFDVAEGEMVVEYMDADERVLSLLAAANILRFAMANHVNPASGKSYESAPTGDSIIPLILAVLLPGADTYYI
jgi:hypothetical protein